MSLETLLEGTPLLAFLQELAAITDDELIDNRKAVDEGEIILGEMTLFEKRLSIWCDRATRQLSQEIATFHGAIQLVDEGSFQGMQETMRRFIERDEEIDERAIMLSKLLSYRFAGAKNMAIRAGFTVVANARRQSRASDAIIRIVSSGGMPNSLAAAILGSMAGFRS